MQLCNMLIRSMQVGELLDFHQNLFLHFLLFLPGFLVRIKGETQSSNIHNISFKINSYLKIFPYFKIATFTNLDNALVNYSHALNSSSKHKVLESLKISQSLSYFMYDFMYFPKWQLPKCAIFQVAISRV